MEFISMNMTASGYKNSTNLTQRSSVQGGKPTWRTWYIGQKRKLYLLWTNIGVFAPLPCKKIKQI